MSDTVAEHGLAVEPWGRDVVVEESGGVPCRMYVPRVRRIPALLERADRWAGRAHVVAEFAAEHSARG